MDSLHSAIQSTPIIDHHAHNLLQASAIDGYDLLSMTSEASGPALWHSTSTLAHIRAVKQLARILGCDKTWPAVQEAIKLERVKPGDAWARRCFEGIETVLIDDGLNPSDVYPYRWHDRLTRSSCKRIIRIERIAETLINNALEKHRNTSAVFDPTDVVGDFSKTIADALDNPNVAGFKSVICYRTGLAIPKDVNDLSGNAIKVMQELAASSKVVAFARLEHEILSPFFVHLTAIAIESSQRKKPFQFHTGLGDNDLNLGLSNPSHLQPFIHHYPTVPIVLLHASYPFTTEAGYLASVYENVYLDIGEVFPFVSQDGQERVIRDALELCPAVKLTWSTDGHWFPETYLLAVIQVREGLAKVLGDFVRREALTVTQAITIVEAILFKTSNELYQLNLDLKPFPKDVAVFRTIPSDSSRNFHQLQTFMDEHPCVKFLRLQWVDYTALLRVRILPIKQALKLCREKKYVGITKAVLGLLQVDETVPGFGSTGEYNLCPQYSSLRQGNRKNTSTLQCEFQEHGGEQVTICPRTILRKQVEKATANDINFLVGSEIEVVFMRVDLDSPKPIYTEQPVNTGGHNWSSARALQSDKMLDMIESIVEMFEKTGIELQQFHSESSPGQYEFILAPLPPLQAVDTLVAARDIISTIASNASLRATLFPKPAPGGPGTGAHFHMSIEPSSHWESFYAGVLEHLRAISAFTYPNEASYERVQDGVWAGGTWVCWGTQNRETPLRRIESSHFEIKCIDGLANPYLAIAAIITAGVGGVLSNKALRIKDCLAQPGELSPDQRAELGITEKLPKSIREALDSLSTDRELCELLGEEVVKTYITIKEEEDKMLKAMEPKERRRWLIERY